MSFKRALYSLFPPESAQVTVFLEEKGYDGAIRAKLRRSGGNAELKEMFELLTSEYGGVPRFCVRCGEFAMYSADTSTIKICRDCIYETAEEFFRPKK